MKYFLILKYIPVNCYAIDLSPKQGKGKGYR